MFSVSSSSIMFSIITIAITLLLLASSSSTLIITPVSAATVTVTPSTSTTVISNYNSKDLFEWPKTRDNGRIDGKRVDFTTHMILEDSLEVKEVQISNSHHTYATFTIRNCVIGRILIDVSLTNVQINIHDCQIGRITVGVFYNTQPMILENVTFRIFNNDFSDAIVKRFGGSSSSNSAFPGVHFTGYAEGQRSWDQVGKLVFGNGTTVSIDNNSVVDDGDSHHYLIRLQKIAVMGMTGELAITNNRIRVRNNTNEDRDSYPIVFALYFMPPQALYWDFDAGLFEEILEDDFYVKKKAVVGSKSWIASGNVINFTDAYYKELSSDDEDARIRFIYFQLWNVFNVDLIDASRNEIIYRADPYVLSIGQDFIAIRFDRFYPDQANELPFLNVSTGIFFDHNILRVEPAYNNIEHYHRLNEGRLLNGDDEWKTFRSNLEAQGIFEQMIAPDSWLRRGTPLLRKPYFVQIDGMHRGIHEVKKISVSNNIIPTEIRAREHELFTLNFHNCNTNIGIINFSSNIIVNASLSEEAKLIFISPHHMTNTQFIVSDNNFNAPDLLWTRVRISAAKFSVNGSPDKCARDRISDPTFFAYNDNCSFIMTNNTLSIGSAFAATALSVLDEDHAIDVNGVMTPHKRGRVNLILVDNNNISIFQNFINWPRVTILEFGKPGEDRDSVQGVSLTGSQRNVTNTSITNNIIIIDATTNPAIAGVASTWPNFLDSGPTFYINNYIRIYNVFSTQVTYTVVALWRASLEDDRDAGSYIIEDNDIELHVDPRYGCSALGCAVIRYSFSPRATNIDAVYIRNNRLLLNNSQGSNSYGVSLTAFDPLSSRPFPAVLGIQELRITGSSFLTDFAGFVISGNNITIIGVFRAVGISFGINGIMNYSAEVPPANYSRFVIDNNNINVETTRNIYSLERNSAIEIGRFFGLAEVFVPPFPKTHVVLTSAFKGNAVISSLEITNTKITTRGGVPAAVNIVTVLEVHNKIHFENISFLNAITATASVTSIATFEASTIFTEVAPPFGQCRGLLNVLPREKSNPVNTAELIFVGSNGEKQEEDEIIIRNVTLDLKGVTADTTAFYWYGEDDGDVSTNSRRQRHVAVTIEDSSWLVRSSTTSEESGAPPRVSDKDASTLLFNVPPHSVSVTVNVTHSRLEVNAKLNSAPAVAFDLSKVPSSSSSASTSIRRNLHITNNSKVIFRLDPSSASSTAASPILFLMNTKSAPGSFIIANSSIVIESSSTSSSSLSLRAADVGDSVREASRKWPLVYTSSSEPGPIALKQPNEDPSSSSSSSLSLFSVSLLNATLYLPANPDQAQVFSSSSSPASGSNNNNNNLFFSSNLAFSAQCTNFVNSNTQRNQQQREQATVVLRPSSVFYTTAVQLAKKGADIAVCEKSATKSLSRSVSVVPTCSRYALLYAGDRRHTVVQATGRTLRVTVALVTGSELLPLITHPETPKRDVPLTQPPAGQAQSEAFTVFRQGHNVTSSSASSSSSPSSSSSSSPPLLYSVNPEVAAARWAYTHVIDEATQQRIEDQQQRQARATLMTLEVRVAAGLRSNRDHTVEIAVSPALLACMTPEIIPVAASSNTSSSSSSFGSSSRFLPVFSSPRGDGWPVVRFTLHRREVGAQPLLAGQMASVSRGAAIAAAGLTGNSMMMSQMNRAETMYRFLDCGFSDEEPLDAIQSPVQIGVGDAQQPGYYQRAAILGNLLMMLLVLLALLGIGLVKWKKRQRSYARKLAAHKAQLLQRRLQRQGAAIDLNKRRRQSSIMKEKGHDETNDLKSTSLLSSSSPAPASPPSSSSATPPPPPPPPLSLVQTLYSVCLPSHTHVAVLGLLQGTVAAAVALLRINGFSGSDAFLAMFALIFTLLFFVWMVYIVLYVLPRHRYVTYIERSTGDSANNSKQDGSGDRRQVYGPSKWFPKCPNCAPLSQVVEPEDNSTRHARRIVPRIQLQRFAAYRALKWFLTPWGDWTLFRTPVKEKVKDPICCRCSEEEAASNNQTDDDDLNDAHSMASFGSGRHHEKQRRGNDGSRSPNRRGRSSASPPRPQPLEKHEIPDRYFRERTDKVIDDYTLIGRHCGLLEYAVCYLVSIAAGLISESETAGDEGCAVSASFALVLNVLPFAYCIALSPFRKKTTYFFAVITGIILTGMSVLVGFSKILSLAALAEFMGSVQLGLDFAVTFKLGVDVVEMFWIVETETMFIPLYYLRHYLFHFGGMLRGIRAATKGQRYRSHFSAKHINLQEKRRNSTSSGGGGTNSERLLSNDEEEASKKKKQNRYLDDYDDDESTTRESVMTEGYKPRLARRHARARTWNLEESVEASARWQWSSSLSRATNREHSNNDTSTSILYRGRSATPASTINQLHHPPNANDDNDDNDDDDDQHKRSVTFHPFASSSFSPSGKTPPLERQMRNADVSLTESGSRSGSSDERRRRMMMMNPQGRIGVNTKSGSSSSGSGKEKSYSQFLHV